MRFFDEVVTAVTSRTADPAWHAQRIRLLWPVHQLKWACILLNEFLPVSGRRRQFAGADSSDARRQRMQRSRTLLRQAVDNVSSWQDVQICSV